VIERKVSLNKVDLKDDVERGMLFGNCAVCCKEVRLACMTRQYTADGDWEACTSGREKSYELVVNASIGQPIRD
jgi:hypothetical protein